MEKGMSAKKIARIDLRKVDLIAYDFDGVMTDNRVIVSQTGSESVVVNRSDGLAVSLIREKGIPQIIISTETNPVVRLRAKKLGIEVCAACQDKAAALKALCRKRGFKMGFVVYVGNDVNDLAVMEQVGYPVAPADAAPEILAVARYVTRARGGEGVVRELYSMLV
jgi:3-deoxy-D-manno-octulosonate 8-phosphate phosphatase (KDO 8-P phosphatase)